MEWMRKPPPSWNHLQLFVPTDYYWEHHRSSWSWRRRIVFSYPSPRNLKVVGRRPGSPGNILHQQYLCWCTPLVTTPHYSIFSCSAEQVKGSPACIQLYMCRSFHLVINPVQLWFLMKIPMPIQLYVWRCAQLNAGCWGISPEGCTSVGERDTTWLPALTFTECVRNGNLHSYHCRG